MEYKAKHFPDYSGKDKLTQALEDWLNEHGKDRWRLHSFQLGYNGIMAVIERATEQQAQTTGLPVVPERENG